MKIYVASSWRNMLQGVIVCILRQTGFAVYDFKHPPGRTGFSWREIDPAWQFWTPEAYRSALNIPLAEAGFASDMEALHACDACVLVLPCGRSAHLEAGWAIGAGKPTYILMLGPEDPELMYKMATRLCLSVGELLEAFGVPNYCA